MLIKTIVKKTTFLMAASLCFIVSAKANSMTAPLNKVRVIKMDAPISQIVIGNPALVTATVLDPFTFSLTGVIAGSTNLIVLDSSSEVQFSTDITIPTSSVMINDVAVFRGTPDNVQNLACNSSKCSPTIAVGNRADYNANVTNYRKALDDEAERNFPEDE